MRCPSHGHLPVRYTDTRTVLLIVLIIDMYTPHISKSPNDSRLPVKRLAFNNKTGAHESQAPVVKFIKGPIPLDWVTCANTLPGKAGNVGIALWFLAGIKKSRTIKLTGEVEKIAGCHRQTLYPALKALQKAGLIEVQPKRGARPTVVILSPLCVSRSAET